MTWRINVTNMSDYKVKINLLSRAAARHTWLTREIRANDARWGKRHVQMAHMTHAHDVWQRVRTAHTKQHVRTAHTKQRARQCATHTSQREQHDDTQMMSRANNNKQIINEKYFSWY